MASAVVDTVPTHAPSRAVGSRDRLFYGSVAVTLAVVALIGFAPTYYLRFFDGGPKATISGGPFTMVHHVHGGLFTAWVALFIVQTTLIAKRRVAVHRRLGIAGGALGVAMVIAGLSTGITMARNGGTAPGIGILEFLVVPVFDMLMFATFLTAALLRRRDKETHKRLMLLAYTSIIAAPIARFPGVLPLGPLGFYGIAFLVVVAGIVYDYVSRGRVHAAYKWGGALLFLSVPLRLAVSGTTLWHSFAQWLIA
jgi:hypothetical protein